MSPEPIASLPELYTGPSDGDPLTDEELALLLAVPRAAESTPDAVLFRLPLGPSPHMGCVDVTCSEARSIVARLAGIWRSKLSSLLNKAGGLVQDTLVGPGTTICIAVNPDFHGIFHLLAFWAIGCTVQVVSMTDPSLAVEQLNMCGCKILLCSGYDDAWIEARKLDFDGVIVRLTKIEQAHELAKLEKQGQNGLSPRWPAPQRPTPMLILQSSGTSGPPKMLWLSLYHYTPGHAYNCQIHLAPAHPERTIKTPYTHSRLVPVPFSWGSFFSHLFVHLTTATPIAFAYFTDILQFSPTHLMDWAITFDVGAIACSAGLVRLTPKAIFEAHADFLRGLCSFLISGSSIDDSLSDLFDRLNIPITNRYGTSEFGPLLAAPKAPFNHLRSCRGSSAFLVRPISESRSDGSRYVELWLTPQISPLVAHYLANGGVPVELEPFPGAGLHQGEPAVNLQDIFQELTVSDNPSSGSEIVYVHVGRHSDQLRLGGKNRGEIDAALYETTLGSEINARMDRSGARSCPWTIDGIQLFGTNMPGTALVIQFCLDHNIAASRGTDPLHDLPMHEIFESVEQANISLELTGSARAHTGKRMLIVSADGSLTHGLGCERLVGSNVSLSLTHKRTPKRWENICKFKPWLDGLDFNDF